MSREPLAIVVAMTREGVIGRDGGLPWHIPEDLKHYKAETTGHAMIMGRKTYDSIGRPLPNRRSIVITRNRALQIPGVDMAPDLETAVRMARDGGDDEPRVVGGAAIFAEALPLATRLILTVIDDAIPGDTRFPAWDEAEWREVKRHPGADPRVTYRWLERIEA